VSALATSCIEYALSLKVLTRQRGNPREELVFVEFDQVGVLGPLIAEALPCALDIFRYALGKETRYAVPDGPVCSARSAVEDTLLDFRAAIGGGGNILERPEATRALKDRGETGTQILEVRV